MAQLAISAAGAAIGFVASGFNPVGAQVGWAVGSMVGAQFGPKQKSYGPRLEDVKVTGSEYGQTIPWAAGHPRVAGQVWWASNRREISTTTRTGKGGGGSEATTYTYEVDILYGLLNREISAVRRIWLNGKLAWTAHIDASAASLSDGEQHAPWSRMTVYTGSAAQLPDPTYESAVTYAPAYRGRGSVFIESLQLGNSGVIPNLTFEVVVDGLEYLATPSFGPEQSTPAYFNNGTPASDSSVFVVPIGQWDDHYATTLVNVYSFDIFRETVQLQSSFNVSVARPTATGTSDVPMMVIAVSTAVRSYVVGGGGASYTMPHFLGGAQLRFARAGADIVFGSTMFGGKQLHRFSTSGGASPVVSSAVLGDFVNSILIVGNVVYAVTTSTKQMYVLDISTLTLQQTINLPSYSSVQADKYPYLFVLRGGVVLVSSSFVDGSYAVYSLQGYAWLKIGNLNSSVVQTTDSGATTCAIGNVVIGGLGKDLPPRYKTWYAPMYVAPNEATLRGTVEELCAGAGMPVDTYDAAALASITKPVRAFVLSQVSSTRSALEQLASAYFFDAYVTDKLYFVPRAGSAVDTIDADDLGTGIEAAEDETLPTQIGSDLEIPAQVSLSYANVDADYTTATEHSDRLLSGQVSTSAVQLPMGFTAAEAKGIADAIVIDGYASRVTGTFSVPLSYAKLVPTDVVAVPDADGNVYRVRIVRRTDEGPLLKFEWVIDDATAIESAGITSDDYTPTVDVALPGDTIMELLDIPLMRDAENTLGHYVAATSAGTTWPGASISRSLDDVEYAEAARVSERAILGVTTTTLGNFTGIGFDERNTVTVSLSYGTLSSSTRAGLLADASINNIMIGAELVRFRAATFVSDGIYTLSGLLRGQKGTEWAMAGHTSSDVVVLIQTAGMRYVSIDLPSLSAERFYKGVTSGKSLASVSSESFTCEGVSLKPLAPVNVRRTVGTANQITVTWDRRTRLACTFTGASGISVPLGELTEAYEVDVVLIAGSVLKRTLTASSASAIYTAAMQTADGIGASTPIRFDVYQMSAVVGRGYVASLTTVGAVTPLPQITTLTVGGSFSSGAALYATLGGVTYNYTSVGGDTNLDGIATSFAAIIDAAAAYTAAAVGSVITVTGAVSASFPVVAGVSAGNNTTTWALTQTASATVAGVGNSIYFGWKNLSDPGGTNAYPFGMNFNLLVQRIDPPLNLLYTVTNADAGGFTDYRILPGLIGAIRSEVSATGDDVTYGFSITPNDPVNGTSTLTTPASEPYNWTLQVNTNIPAVSGLAANAASGVTPATLRPQIVTLTLAGTPATGRTYRATLGGVNFDYTAGGGDTTMALVATGLAAVIDANASYIASAVGAVITITHASNNVPFTYSATVIASTVTLTAATTQEAA
jgi:hypothetical protein